MTDCLADPERELALSYAERQARPYLRALWAVDERFGAILAGTTEAAIGEMRLLWWRDALTEAPQATRAEPLIEAAATAMREAGTSGADWGAMTEGWHALLQQPIEPAELERFARERGSRLFSLSATILGAPDWPGLEDAGQGWALTDLAYRITDGGVAAEARARATAFFPGRPRWPRELRPLGALTVLARRDAHAGRTRRRQGSPGRVARMAWHRLTGR
jgi:phytoene synthase